MKFRRLPPLHALEAFEHAARSGSFKDAADALHLTPSAISHQIKALEVFLGFALFRRGNRSLELTDGGRAYLRVVQDALQQLRDGSGRVAQRYGRAQLKISMGAFLASEIVMPALPEFQQRHPEIDVHLETSTRNVDLLHEDVDVALRFGAGPWPKLRAHPLLAVDAVPVCDPATAARLQRLAPDAIGDLALIHSSAFPNGWQYWERATGVSLAAASRDLWVDSYLAIIRAAEEGAGLALGLVPLINPLLQRGRLVAPWPALRARSELAYYLLHRVRDGERPEILAFHDWVRERLPNALAEAAIG